MFSFSSLSHPLQFSRAFSSFPSSQHLNHFSLLLQGPISPSHLLQTHAQLLRIGADQDNLIATRFIGRHSNPLVALRVFHCLINPNIFPFNAIIRVLAEAGFFSHAFSLFKALKLRLISPNGFTFSFLLKACHRSTDTHHLLQIHTHIVKSGFSRDSVVCNGLLALYSKGGGRDISSAHKLFDEMPDKGMVCSWTCLIAGYVRLGCLEGALHLFLQMMKENLRPEDDTMVSVLSACSNLKPQEIARWKKKLSEFEVDVLNGHHCDHINTILVYLEGKEGEIEKSREVFDRMSERSVLAWNAMVSAYVQNGYPMEALGLFRLMLTCSKNPKPNHVTMVSALTACAQVGDLDLGRWIHEYMKAKGGKGLLESNTFLATAFIDMYCKCGNLEMAREVFHRMSAKDVVSFNVMIMGLAMNGKGEESLQLFYKMAQFDVQPNDGTFLGVLSACTHSGLVTKGRALFSKMKGSYLVTPKLEHYACFIDLLARAGHVEEALEVARTMPVEPNALVWGALLGACLVHSRADLAPFIAGRLLDADPTNSAGYVMLSNAYAVNQRWNEIGDLRGVMRERRVRKQPGCSWININGVVHEFLVGTSYPEIQSIYQTLNGLLCEMRSLGH